jgi:hypothetical protein
VTPRSQVNVYTNVWEKPAASISREYFLHLKEGGSTVFQNVLPYLPIISYVTKKKQVILLFTADRISNLNVVQIDAKRCY